MKRLSKIRITEQETDREQNAVVPASELQEEVEGRLTAFWARTKEKLRPFPWKKINAKNALIAGCLVIVAVAGYLNIRYGPSPDDGAPENEVVQEEESAESFFTSAVIDRERARGEALEVLVGITEDETASESAKTDAYTQMERIANETSWEIDIENLVKSKGFEECVAIINEDTANVVVSTEGLTPGEVAQIKEIVYLEASIQPKDIKIIEKN